MVVINDDIEQSASANSTNEDYEVQSYQDNLDTDPNKVDPVMHEENDDAVETFGVPARELRDEMDKRDLDDPNTTDDMRSEVEDFDDGQGVRD